METPKPSIEKLAIVSGVLICIALIFYFLLMKLMGFADIPELRFLNFLIAGAGAIAAIRYYNSKTQSHIKYLEGLLLGCISIIISAVLFSLFIVFYLSNIDTQLLDVLRTSSPMMGKYLTPFSAGLSVIVEGIVSGLVISFCLMQYFKDDTLHSPFREQFPGMHQAEKE